MDFGEGASPEKAARVQALDRCLVRGAFPGFREAVPTQRALLVVFDPRTIPGSDVGHHLLRLDAPALAEVKPRLHVIPTKYGGEDGPDLAFVADAKGLSPAQVVALHSGRDYTALMLGFTPGFAYLGPLPEALVLPRRGTPRPRVPPGSVAIAADQTGIYPSATPGGWHLLGRTSSRLFDPRADPPALIQPGDTVRFVPVDELPDEPAPIEPRHAVTEPCLEVLDGGLLTTVQDAGRFGYRRWGVAWAGPMDARALRAANLFVGNPPGTAALECTVSGPTLRFLRAGFFAIAGADLGAFLDRADLGRWSVPLGTRVLARPGNVLAFHGRRRGCRAYVAFSGGIDVPCLMGSRATDLQGGFGGHDGRALRKGDVFSLGHVHGEGAVCSLPALPVPAGACRVRVVLGPQSERFTQEAVGRFLSETYRLDATSDRTGYRLSGPRLEHTGEGAEIASDGLLPGCIQVPPEGQPILMMADSPTTGGYAKLATVVSGDLHDLAQLLPGEGCVTFTAVAPEDGLL